MGTVWRIWGLFFYEAIHLWLAAFAVSIALCTGCALGTRRQVRKLQDSVHRNYDNVWVRMIMG